MSSSSIISTHQSDTQPDEEAGAIITAPRRPRRPIFAKKPSNKKMMASFPSSKSSIMVGNDENDDKNIYTSALAANKKKSDSNNKASKYIMLARLALFILVSVGIMVGVLVTDKKNKNSDKRIDKNKNDNKSGPLFWTQHDVESLLLHHPQAENDYSSTFVFQDFDVSANGQRLVVVDTGVPDYSVALQRADEVDSATPFSITAQHILETPLEYTTRLRLFAWTTMQVEENETNGKDDNSGSLSYSSWTLQDIVTVKDTHPISSPVVHFAGMEEEPLVILTDENSTGQGNGGTVRFYRATANGELRFLEKIMTMAGATVTVNDDGTHMAIGNRHAMMIMPEQDDEHRAAIQVYEINNNDSGSNRDGLVIQALGSAISNNGSDGSEFSLGAFGASLGGVALSGDGNVLAVGVPMHAGFGPMAGQVRVWRFQENSNDANVDADATGDWIELPPLEGKTGQGLGSNLRLSADGTILAATTMGTNQVLVYEQKQVDGSFAWVARGEALPGTTVEMTTDGERIATVSGDGAVFLFDWSDDEQKWVNQNVLDGRFVRLASHEDSCVVFDAQEKSIETWTTTTSTPINEESFNQFDAESVHMTRF